MDTRTLRFIRRGDIVALDNVPPDRTLLELLREDLACTGTKEGCGEGDCGACTVVTAQLSPEGEVEFRAVNSCIRLAHSVDGMALWTVEDLAGPDGTLHPVQEAMVACHGSQCGFCTPGFVMSLFGLYQDELCKGRAVDRDAAQQALTGNLCRCTGYRPILDAAMRMQELPRVPVDEGLLRTQLQAVRRSEGAGEQAYMAPESLEDLLRLRAAHPRAQVVAGCTDAGLWVTKLHMRFAQVLDVTRVDAMRRIGQSAGELTIGAAVPLEDAFEALIQDRPQLRVFAQRFAGRPIRNSGTLGGNIANGSPIGDSMPLLIALGARIVLQSVRGERELAVEDFYTGYRKNVLAEDEVLTQVRVPRPAEGEFLRAYKVSKRFDDDISAVCLVLRMLLRDGRAEQVSIGAGGVAATPVRARAAQSAIEGRPWTEAQAAGLGDALRAEFQPISDMRASAAYRSQVLGRLARRFWLESQGVRGVNLESFSLQELAS